MERAARIHQYGAPEVLAVEPVDVTAPGPGEVRIRHKAIGLNFVERVHTITNGAGVAAVYDAVGRDTFLNSLRTLRVSREIVPDELAKLTASSS